MLRLPSHKDRNLKSVTTECSDEEIGEEIGKIADGPGVEKDGVWTFNKETHH